MRKFFSKFCLDVLPSALATFIAGILLTSYHHFFLPNTPVINPRTGIEIGGPSSGARASQVVDTGHAAIAEPTGGVAKSADAKPSAPDPKAAEPAKPESPSAVTQRKRSQDIKAARPQAKPEKPPAIDKSPAAEWQHAAERAIARTPASTPPRPPAAPAGHLAPPVAEMQPLPSPAASATPPAPTVPQPFSVNELNEKLEGVRRVQPPPPPPPAPPEPGLGERIFGSMFGSARATVPESTN